MSTAWPPVLGRYDSPARKPEALPDARLDDKPLSTFGRCLKLRQVNATGCNVCEADTIVLGMVGWELGCYGIHFVASPRHAEGVLITGPMSRHTLDSRRPSGPFLSLRSSLQVGCAIAGARMPTTQKWRVVPTIPFR